MKFRALQIEGVFAVDIKPIGDDRGYFARTFCTEEFGNNSLCTRWAQMNMSFSQTAGTLRGLHFQRAPASEVKFVRCISGRILDVILDLRRGSKSFGHHVTIELEGDRKNAVYVPIGCAHGFQTLSDNVELQYFHSHAYAPDLEGGVNPLDPDLGIKWPLPIAQISDRDNALLPFSECEPL